MRHVHVRVTLLYSIAICSRTNPRLQFDTVTQGWFYIAYVYVVPGSNVILRTRCISFLFLLDPADSFRRKKNYFDGWFSPPAPPLALYPTKQTQGATASKPMQRAQGGSYSKEALSIQGTVTTPCPLGRFWLARTR